MHCLNAKTDTLIYFCLYRSVLALRGGGIPRFCILILVPARNQGLVSRGD